MPLFHIHGLIAGLLAPLSAGGAIACPGDFNAFRFFEWLDVFQPTWYTAVPTMHQLVLTRAGRHAETLARTRLRFVRSSSAPLPPVVLERIEQTFGAPMIEAYGMTEASHQMAAQPLPPGLRKPGAVGRATGIEMAILDPAGDLLAPHERGEVSIRGASVTAGYEANPEANATAFTAAGWFRTGDEGYLDEDGYLFLTGRLKELINRGGEKVAPREVEEVILRHPAVRQAVCFALPHATLGEDVAAAVIRNDGADLDESAVRDLCGEHLAPFKVPRKVVFVDEIPVGPTGKLQRIGLAERLGLGVGAHPLGFFPRLCYSTGMANVVRSKEVVVIAPDLRERFGWGDEGDIIEVECDGEMVSFLLPPVHNDSLAGSLAPYSNVTLSEDEWDEARGRLD